VAFTGRLYRQTYPVTDRAVVLADIRRSLFPDLAGFPFRRTCKAIGFAPMDVVLQTNTTDPMLGLLDITRFDDGSGYVAKLRVSSRGFMVDRPFYIDESGLVDFVKAIGAMDRTLTEAAELRAPYEDDFIRLELRLRGSVAVTGEVRECSDWEQRLRFGFDTDQTVLGPFARDLQAVLGLAVSPVPVEPDTPPPKP
jgi:hypothetical protein